MIGRPYALVWSQSRNDIKVQTLESCMSETRQAYADNAPGDWRLMLAGNKAEVMATAESILPTLRARLHSTRFPAANAEASA